MRLNEICQLYCADVRQEEEVWVFDVNDEEDKRLKNSSSRRRVPVHSVLIKLGFLEYLEEVSNNQTRRLWPHLKHYRDGYAGHFSRWFQGFNMRYVTKNPKRVFHSFRHCVGDALKQSGVEESIRAELLGHAHRSITTGRYGKEYGTRLLLQALEQLSYDLMIEKEEK
jgi:integrase